MKTLDVQALHKAIDQTLEQLKHQSDEIVKVKKSVDGITSLDDALKGKGGDAIRNFYEECHTPFLQFYETLIGEYQSALKKIKNALNSFEPNHNGFISQTFLEHELEQGVNSADRTTKRLVSKTNASIAKVSHIVDLPDLNDSGFHEQNQKALKEINQTIEKLHTFDREQTSALKTAENDLETMQRYISRLEKMYTGPKIEITGYQKGSILKPDEMDTLRGGQDTAMGVMLDKLDKRSKLEKEVSEVSEHDVKLYKLRKKLENTSDSAEYLKIAKEIGYDNLTPEQMEHVKSIEFWDDPLQTTIDNIKETGKGFIDGIVDAGEKLDEAGEKYLGPVYKSAKGSAVAGYDLAKDFVDGGIQLGWNIGWTIDHLHKDPQVVLDTVLGYDYKGAFMSMVDTLAEKWDEKVVHGDAYSRAHYFTYMIGSLWGLKSGKSSVSTGSKDLAKAGKAAVNKAKKAGKTIKQSIKPPNNRYTPALQGILQDAPNSINVKNTPLIRELVEDKKKSVLFNSNKGTSGQTVKKVRKTIVPTVKSGEFNKWFNTLSTKQLDELWSDKKIRRAIERQLRAPGGMHEWHLVSRAPTFKHWGVTAEQIRELRTAINEVEFVNPTGKHGGLGSTAAHNELLKIIDSSKDYNMFVRRLNNWANYRLKGGVEALPEGLRIKK
ncbi:LXG domain-containing protein [Bacillus paralicheniformis]|uniref:ribonuclease YeeF family protein n=1 Tax=Bacillus paralicheniformis TaxID=1648923 RepID=UPI00137E3DCD|nr:LXG domain-containing protein [Bacillus paralicheniformis]MCU4668058.1 LXG domain-containing protein [Bacillus paralicheniformis]MEC1824748.1 LXG domain-containing protein [Bacillus paralicheniformis]TWK28494.1 Ribonuclease YxiD [Bacillus paralicheniformis]